MTNKHDDAEPSVDCSPRVAALLAVHLVSEVLGEAYVIANAAKESGQPWRYLSMLKNFKNSGTGFTHDEDKSFEESKGDSMNENNIEVVANIVATSTPQKISDRQIGCSDDTLTAFNASFNDSITLIGQGDEEIENQQDDSTNSTSMFINHLFDMSEAEKVILCDDTEDIANTPEPNDLLAEAMNKIMDTYVSNAFQSMEPIDLPSMDSFIASVFPILGELPISRGQTDKENVEEPVEMLSRSDYSEYSFLADAFVPDIGRDVAFYISEEGSTEKDDIFGRFQTATLEEITESADLEAVATEKEFNSEAGDTEKECELEAEDTEKELDFEEENTEKQLDLDAEETDKESIKQKNDSFQLYENAYMTLNRDYDQCSEDDGFPILQDPKEMVLQEVELMTSNTSEEEFRYTRASVSKPKVDEASVSGMTGSRKSTLVRKCRLQGARLFACLRGWWRRKTPGKRKESRRSGLAACPLSPEARRRTSSLLENRLLRSPSPSRPGMWKFNTVNEALVNSSRWKDYTFDAMAERSGDL